MSNKKRVIISLSGGLDSSTLLALAVSKKQQDEIEKIAVVKFKYGSKHQKYEMEAADRIIDHYYSFIDDLRTIVLNYNDVFSTSALVNSKEEIPAEEYNEMNIKKTSVPFRNGIMLSFIAALADSFNYNSIWMGVHKAFNEEATYPDCTPSFIETFGRGITGGTFNKVEVYAPFVDLLKSDIVKLGLSLEVPYELTYSCYNGGEKHCGVCATCRDRLAAFAANGVEDPVEYVKR